MWILPLYLQNKNEFTIHCRTIAKGTYQIVFEQSWKKTTRNTCIQRRLSFTFTQGLENSKWL